MEDDIRIVSRFLFEEERAGRQRYQLLRRRLSDSQLLLEYRVGEEESRRVKMVQEACEEIKKQCRGRALFVTSKGFIGLGPKDAQLNDEVYTLIGGETPFVLRRTAISNEFRLIGEAYIHGIMNGELWNWLVRSQSGVRKRCFNLIVCKLNPLVHQ